MADLASRFYLLRVGASGEDQRPVRLNCGEQLVGSIADAALRVGGSGVAPMHANLWVQHDAVYVTDLGSEGGTAVNAGALAEGFPTALEPGDEVRFGDVSFVLQQGDEDDEADLDLLAPATVVGAGPSPPEEDTSLTALAFLDDATVERLRGYFDTFCRFCQVAAATADRYALLDALLSATAEVTQADRYFVLLGDRPDAMKVRAARYVDEDRGDRGPPSSEFVRRTLQASKPVTTYDALADERFSGRESVILHDVRSAIGVRLAAGGQTLGVLYLDSQCATGLFGADDAELVHTLGNVASLKLLYLASRTALLDLLTRTRDEVSRYRELAIALGEQVQQQADEIQAALDRAPAIDPGARAEIDQAAETLRAAAAPYIPPPRPPGPES